LSIIGGSLNAPPEKSALRLNLKAILANNTDHSEEFDGLPAFDFLTQCMHAKFGHDLKSIQVIRLARPYAVL